MNIVTDIEIPKRIGNPSSEKDNVYTIPGAGERLLESQKNLERVIVQLFYLLMALFLFLNILVGLVRVFRGPTKVDRMLAGQLFGTLGTAICLLLAEALQMEGIRDTALVFVILSIVFVVSFVRRLKTDSNHDNQ